MTFIINTDIPGWTSEHKLNMLARHAKDVPFYGWIVEIGAYVGRSTYALGMNKHPNTLLTSIDPWPSEQFEKRPIRKDAIGKYSENDCYSIEAWLNNTQEIPNKEYLRMWSPIPRSSSMSFKKLANLVFIDGGHTYEETFQNLEDWVCYRTDFRANVIVDDYSDPAWPDVTRAVDDFMSKQRFISSHRLTLYSNHHEHYAVINKV